MSLELSRPKFFIRPIVRISPIFYEKYLAYLFTANDLVVELIVQK
jgi:hypothetical protein